MNDNARKTRTFESGEILIKEGELGKEAYLIRSGLVLITRMEDGKKVNLAALCEGHIVGEMALIDETVSSATVTADQETMVEVIRKEDLDAMIADAPEELQVILSQLFESLRTSNDLVSMYASHRQAE